MEYLLLILGFVLLIKGADMFVEGSSNIAKFFKIPTIIIGLTLVAFGTSAPEAAVSITAGLNGNSDIAISNIVGSCLFNLLCVLGVTAMFKDIIFIVIGLACVVLGGDLTVDNATLIAKAWGLSDRFIGLTVVAIGTSLPELCTSLVALFKGENDIAVGNVIGSNIFNILFILGASSLLSPMNIGIESVIDLMILIIGSIGILIFFFNDFKIKKPEALSMLMFYATYCIYIFIR